MTKLVLSLSLVFILSFAMAQEMSFEEYNPPSTLVVPENPVTRAKFPFVDVHSHQRLMTEEQIANLVAEMDEINMKTMVNLSGRGFSRDPNYDGAANLNSIGK